MFSLSIIATSVVFVRRVTSPIVRHDDRSAAGSGVGPDDVRGVVGGAYVGTVVTVGAPRGRRRLAPHGLDPASVSQLHADAVFLLLGLTVGTLLAFHAVGASASARRAVGWLLGAELVQGSSG